MDEQSKENFHSRVFSQGRCICICICPRDINESTTLHRVKEKSKRDARGEKGEVDSQRDGWKGKQTG